MNDAVLARILDAADSTTGGGSAAALAGAMAAGLLGMVARLSEGRDLGLASARYRLCAAEADSLCNALLAGARDDADAYALVKGAYALPHADDDARERRRTAVEEALVAAAAVPAKNARRCHRVKELCDELTGKSSPAAASDLAVAGLLAAAAVVGCALNVEVNACMVPEVPAAIELRADAEKLRRRHEPTHRSAKEPA